ncbi:MAG: peptidoglycan-binding protein [Ruminococcaceae bacterium]|nr:peptidoglycan-binding protein [Oscillospiraceae bacterium]
MYHNQSNTSQEISAEPGGFQNSVSYIQENLRQLSYHDDDIYSVGIDGMWGAQTRDALKSFQRKYGLPDTGVADIKTWELLREAADASRKIHSPTMPIKIFPRYPSDYFWDRESSPIHIQILQYVLGELSSEYKFENIQTSGIYDEPTHLAVMKFQEKNGLPTTGAVDRITWNEIADQYNKIADVSNR